MSRDFLKVVAKIFTIWAEWINWGWYYYFFFPEPFGFFFSLRCLSLPFAIIVYIKYLQNNVLRSTCYLLESSIQQKGDLSPHLFPNIETLQKDLKI